MVPVGILTLLWRTAFETSSMPTPLEASAPGSSCTLTAYFCAPKTCTWATPLIMDTLWAMSVSAYSFTWESGRVGELRARYKTGWSAGLTFRYEGGLGMSLGSWFDALAIIDCT